ncbi:MAG: glutaredoxin domain-containing protein [Myxococcota bacterium]|mgnify:CR=1 FL=1|jgi:glutaredoxin 3|nr:glutaredoxin domain-containing protein [Myxococcota bacterium]
MSEVKIYRTTYCPYCDMAERLFKQLDVAVEKIDVTDDQEKRMWLVKETGQRTVPQIFIDGKSIGGFTDANALYQKGELQKLLGL